MEGQCLLMFSFTALRTTSMVAKGARHTELWKFLKCNLGIVVVMFLGNRGKRPLQVIIQRLSGDKAYFCILQSIAGLIISTTEGVLFAGGLRLFQTHFSGFCCLFSQKYSPPVCILLHERFVKRLILNQNILLGIRFARSVKLVISF